MHRNQSSPFLFVLIAFLVIGCGAYAYYSPPVPNIAPVNQDQPRQIKTVIQPNVLIYTAAFDKRDQTVITLPYQFDGDIPVIWIGTNTQAGSSPINILARHPLLENLPWKSLTENGITLFQKNVTFKSVQAFLDQPPTKGKILADPQFIQNQLAQYNNTIEITETSTINEVDYVLTTYNSANTTTNDTVSIFSATINTSGVQPNGNNELVWLINAPLTSSSNPLYLGEFHVDYQ